MGSLRDRAAEIMEAQEMGDATDYPNPIMGHTFDYRTPPGPSSLEEQGSWVRIRHEGREYTFCRLSVTRVDLLHSVDKRFALTIHQQGLHEWIRLGNLKKETAEAIRDAVLKLDGEGWV